MSTSTKELGPVSDLTGWMQSEHWIQILPSNLRDRVIADCRETKYLAKQTVAGQGELATTWIGVREGLLKVSSAGSSGRTIMLTAVPKGSWVGEGSVIKRERRRYELIALRDTRVVHVPRATFLFLLESSPAFSRHVIDLLNERVGQFIAAIEVGRIVDPAQRLAGAIHNLFSSVLCPRAALSVNASQAELGELAGLSRSTTNAAVKKLESLQLISSVYGGVVVLNLDRLHQFVYSSNVADHNF